MKRKLTIVTMILVVTFQIVSAQQANKPQPSLAEAIQSVTDRPEFKHAFFGIEFYSLDTGKPVYTLNADKLFTPGSTTKLLTEGTALELLGGDYRFHTRVYRTGAISSDGILNGDLVLVASGDPNLSGRIKDNDTMVFEDEDHSYAGAPETKAVPGDTLFVIRKLASEIAAKNIKTIHGRVLIDISLFAEGEKELGTGAVISPIVVNDNLIDVMVTPGTEGAPMTVKTSPETSYATFVNRTTTGKAGSPSGVRFSSDVADTEGKHTITVSGSQPAGTQGILYSYKVPRPSLFAQTVLIEALREKGIKIEGWSAEEKPDFAKLASAYITENVVAEHVSPPLKEEVKITLKVSQNLHASMTPSIVRSVLAQKGRTGTGFDIEREFLQKAGLDTLGAQQGDGAGGDAHFTPEFMVAYLTYMSKQKDYQDFYNALPILGRDGTLFDIQPKSSAAGHVHAKTGTFSVYDPLNRRLLVTAKGLAGYMTTAKGQHLAFAIYVNNVSVSLAPDETKRIAGQALGEIAALAYEIVQ